MPSLYSEDTLIFQLVTKTYPMEQLEGNIWYTILIITEGLNICEDLSLKWYGSFQTLKLEINVCDFLIESMPLCYGILNNKSLK
jgi:hypothetical protein